MYIDALKTKNFYPLERRLARKKMSARGRGEVKVMAILGHGERSDGENKDLVSQEGRYFARVHTEKYNDSTAYFDFDHSECDQIERRRKVKLPSMHALIDRPCGHTGMLNW